MWSVFSCKAVGRMVSWTGIKEPAEEVDDRATAAARELESDQAIPGQAGQEEDQRHRDAGNDQAVAARIRGCAPPARHRRNCAIPRSPGSRAGCCRSRACVLNDACTVSTTGSSAKNTARIRKQMRQPAIDPAAEQEPPRRGSSDAWCHRGRASAMALTVPPPAAAGRCTCDGDRHQQEEEHDDTRRHRVALAVDGTDDPAQPERLPVDHQRQHVRRAVRRAARPTEDERECRTRGTSR